MIKNKEDIYELIDKFDKSSLCKLDISFNSPDSGEINIKMGKSKNGKVRTLHSFDREFEKVENYPVVNNSGKTITAPLVGTFYSAPSPDSEPYVKVGDKVTLGMAVCIIEAMKTMNEIESETEGKIIEILVKNGSPVEYGQPLFKVE